ncbi:MAG: alpha/beta fold hydrolase [Angustibacter sp.]
MPAHTVPADAGPADVSLDVPGDDPRAIDDETVELSDPNSGEPFRLALRRASGGTGPPAGRPFLLVHGLSSNAQVWDDVAGRLAGAGREVVAVDLRGHGRSGAPRGGYDTDTSADDLARLCRLLGWTADVGRAPVVAGQSWGGNVALALATAGHPDVTPAAVALVDGGWLALGRRFATFEDCWAQLAPPRFDDLRYDDLADRIRRAHPDWPVAGVRGTLANLRRLPDGGVAARLDRAHHREILRSMWAQDPAERYSRLRVPTLLLPAGEPAAVSSPAAEKTAGVAQLLAAVPTAEVRWYPGADHDLHAQYPDQVAADLLALTARVRPAGRAEPLP